MNHRSKCKTVRHLEENRGDNFQVQELGKEFLDMTPRHET